MSSPCTIRLVVATREDRQGFFEKTATGRSLKSYRPPGVQLILAAGNTRGLPALYNRAIDLAREAPSILVFAHDDLHLCDSFWHERVAEGLAQFDIIGLAGNRRRLPGQPSWAFANARREWDDAAHLSGTVTHGQAWPPKRVCVYGPSKQEVKLLDGLFLAAHSQTLHTHGLQFDARFDFHFYDMDFCRQAEAKGLRMGTWPIALMHESGGNFASPAWRQGYERYLGKWGE